jgi:hypothetical protein
MRWVMVITSILSHPNRPGWWAFGLILSTIEQGQD